MNAVQAVEMAISGLGQQMSWPVSFSGEQQSVCAVIGETKLLLRRTPSQVNLLVSRCSLCDEMSVIFLTTAPDCLAQTPLHTVSSAKSFFNEYLA